MLERAIERREKSDLIWSQCGSLECPTEAWVEGGRVQVSAKDEIMRHQSEGRFGWDGSGYEPRIDDKMYKVQMNVKGMMKTVY